MYTQNGPFPKTVLSLLCLVLFLLPGSGAAAETELDFFYFNPDSLQSNLNRLKKEMDNLFHQTDLPVAYQAFARYADFDRSLRQKKPAFLFVPEWYLRQKSAETLSLRPLLTPMRQGRRTYHKVLLAQPGAILMMSDLSNRSLATTAMGPYGDDLLNKVLFHKADLDAKELHMVHVPKDSDALFALVLGQVELALVSKGNLDFLFRMNPVLQQAVEPIMESEPIPLPVLCYMEGRVSAPDIQRFSDVFVGKRSKAKLLRLREMLQIDSWQPLSVGKEKGIIQPLGIDQ